MQRSLSRQDYKEFALAAHAIKGTLLQCGLFYWAQEAQTLYENAKTGGEYNYAEACTSLNEGLSLLLGNKSSEPVCSPKRQQGKKDDTCKILVMDDDEVIRQIVAEMLRVMGYEGDFTSSGEEAVVYYRKAMENGSTYSLVITDLMVQQGMGGKETAKKILSMDSHAKLLLCSGDTTNPVMIKHKDYGFLETLSKPYTLKGLSIVLGKYCL